MTSRPTAEPHASAAETYAARAGDIARLIDILQQELGRHAAEARSAPACWGKAGDLGHVRGGLIDLVGFMSGMDRGEVEAFLAE